MSDIARAVLVGRLTRDPELNDTGKILKLGLACNYRKKSGDDWTDEVSFFDVTVFGNRAQGLASFLEKGRQIAVDGRIVQERWEKDGQNRSAVKFYADEVTPLGSKSENASNSSSGSDVASDFQPVGGGGPSPDDDIPFAPSVI